MPDDVVALRAWAGRRLDALVAELEHHGFDVTVTWRPHDDSELEPDVEVRIVLPGQP